MADRNLRMKISLAEARRNSIQTQVNVKREQISNIQDQIDKMEEQILKLDKNVNALKIRAQKQDEVQAKQQQSVGSPIQQEDAPVGDAATSVASLDGASQSGGDYKTGWKFYDKIDNKKRKRKMAKITEYMSKVSESFLVDKCDEVGNG